MSEVIPITITAIHGSGFSIKARLGNLVAQMRTGGMPYQDALREFEQHYIAHLLRENDGHLGKTALTLGMHRNTLTRTLRHETAKMFTSSKNPCATASYRNGTKVAELHSPTF